MTVPPYFFTSGNTEFMLSSSPFTELISAFPLYILIARSSTAGLDESLERRICHRLQRRHGFLHRFRFVDLGQTYVHIENMRSGFALTHAFVQNVVEIPLRRASFSFGFPVGLMRSPIRIGESATSTACVYEENDGLFFSTGARNGIEDVFLTVAAMYSGVVPQHPPSTVTPFPQALPCNRRIPRRKCHIRFFRPPLGAVRRSDLR